MNFVDEENLSDSGGNNDGGISFEDSDRFDEDMSLCSCGSDPESICGDWRGWKRSNNDFSLSRSNQPNAETLIEKCCKVVAMSVPFETVERMCPNLPEQLLLRIAFWSFPQTDDNIRLYSCLANGSSEEFSKGEQLYRAKAVVEALQIGLFLLIAVYTSEALDKNCFACKFRLISSPILGELQRTYLPNFFLIFHTMEVSTKYLLIIVVYLLVNYSQRCPYYSLT